MEPNPRFWNGLHVCVTGGTGFLGYQIVRCLLDAGARVRVLALPCVRPHPLLAQTNVASTFGDVRDAGLTCRVLGNCDVIFHTAGVVATWGPGMREMDSVHREGTSNVLRAARQDARVVHTSSIVAVGASRAPVPLTEDAPFNLRNLKVEYVSAKRASERLALAAAAAGQSVIVTNPGYLVGPEDHGLSILGRFCLRFWKGRMPVATPGGMNFVDVRDVAKGHLLAAEHGRPGRRYILGGENFRFPDFLALLAAVAGLNPRLLAVLPRWVLSPLAGLAHGCSWLTGAEPYPSVQQVRMTRYHWFARSDRAARELGYRSRRLALCLAETFRWFASRGKVQMRGLNGWWMRPSLPDYGRDRANTPPARRHTPAA